VALVLVDAENVRRSQWPNISEEELVELVREWAKRAAELDGYWLVTSDRELRERAGGRAERVIGGGSFANELRPRG